MVGVAFLLLIDPGQLALVWETFGSFQFILNMLTHMFAHGNWEHLLGNYIFVFPYALYVEHRVGAKSFCKWWLFAGFCALVADAAVVALGQAQRGIIGSSGACFGIVIAALFLVKEHKWARLACQAVAIYLLAEQANDAWNSFFGLGRIFGGGIAYIAHFGGGLGGLYLALKQRRLEARQLAAQDASK